MRFIFITALKDLRILRREPFSVATWIGIPLCIGLLIQLVFRGGEAHLQGVLLIADQDRTVASRFLTDAFGSQDLAKMIKVEAVDEAAGRARINRGDGSALLVIPPGLDDAFLHHRPYHLQLFTNASQRILPSIIQQVLETMVDGAFYLQRVASSDPPSGRPIEITHLVQGLMASLSPPLIEVDTTVQQEKRRHASAGDLFFPNLIFLSLLLMANGLSTDIWKERTFGTLRRVAVSPASISGFLAGRLLMVALVYSFVAIAAVVVAKYLAGVTISNLAAAAVWAAICGTIFYVLLLPLAITSSNPRGADVRGNLLVFPLAMLGGCFFPFDVLPDWMVRIGRLTPNGMAVLQFQDVLHGVADPRHLAQVLAILLVLAAIAFAISIRRLKGAFLQ